MEAIASPDTELSKKLIQLVKDQPFLYDKDLEEFKDESKKTDVWKVIAQSLNLEEVEAQMRWSRLRVEFGRHRRKRQAAEICGTQVRDWPLYSLLTWLAPHVKMRAKRGKRKKDKNVQQENYGYKPILPRPANWLVNVDGGVSVEVNPSIVMQNNQDDISESFIVSPDTADVDDDASQENAQQYSEMPSKDLGTGKLSSDDTSFIREYGIEATLFNEEMRAAVGTQSLSHCEADNHFRYSLEDNKFIWKKLMEGDTFFKLGCINVKKVTVTETYEEILDKLIEKLSNIEENIRVLENENAAVKTDRDKALATVKELAATKADWEKHLYGRFVSVLNAKKEKIQTLEEELEFRNSETDPDTARDDGEGEDDYAAATDVDSENSNEGADSSFEGLPCQSPKPPTSSRRKLEVFSSFDSEPGSPSPAPSMPKRARMPADVVQVQVAPTQEHASSVMDVVEVPVQNNVTEDEEEEVKNEEDDDDMVTLGENTQDLLAEF